MKRDEASEHEASSSDVAIKAYHVVTTEAVPRLVDDEVCLRRYSSYGSSRPDVVPSVLTQLEGGGVGKPVPKQYS
jgi:hypothetical protein